jgi:predicted TIM-barrel fold metal-dependent hydrolase
MSLGRIDVHAHFLPPFYRDALIAAGLDHPDGMPAIPDWSEQEALNMMDSLDIRAAVLSISSPGVHFGDDKMAKALSRRLNEEGTRLRQAHPGRFGLFAATPLPNVEMAIEEAIYAMDVLGAEGVGVESNHHGIYHGDAKFDPFYAELNKRKAAMFIHPTSPCCAGCQALSLGFPRPMGEFMFETTRTVTNLILSGVTTRFPDIRVVVPHAVAALPVLAARIEGLAPFIMPGKEVPSMKAEMRKIYFDTAGEPLPELMGALLQIADPRRLLYGSDWPFTPIETVQNAAMQLDQTTLFDETLRQAIMTDNSLTLFPWVTQSATESTLTDHGLQQ